MFLKLNLYLSISLAIIFVVCLFLLHGQGGRNVAGLKAEIKHMLFISGKFHFQFNNNPTTIALI